jgi:hypothetical protein
MFASLCLTSAVLKLVTKVSEAFKFGSNTRATHQQAAPARQQHAEQIPDRLFSAFE